MFVAQPFRTWCRSLASVEGRDPKRYLERLEAAEDSLAKLARTLGSTSSERLQVSALTSVGFQVNLPVPILKKIVDYLDVDIRFFRPRSFLLNLPSSARQVRRLAPELARVFSLDAEFAQEVCDYYFRMAEEEAVCS